MDLRTATVPALSALPGLVHGFEQRRAGAPVETREASHARVCAALQGSGRLLLLRQVHGATVVEAPWERRPEADAAVAASPGWLLGIQTADCLPVLLVDPERRVVAAAHAGWRGTAAGVVARAVAALAARGSRPEDLVAALGPGIGPCCYEVGDDVRAAFSPSGEGFFRPGPNGRPHLDLRAANARQLVDAGLRPEALHHVTDCTRCHADLYCSYRREGKAAGLMISFVGFRVS
jgi:purine-nucleoside/S-methyl-5'-thioadenosine phosphorylase / adenosine deaminase